MSKFITISKIDLNMKQFLYEICWMYANAKEMQEN